jgi:D-3-phosphoglycerate dehydrogenase
MKVIVTDHGFPHVEQEERLAREAGADFGVVQCKTEDEVIASCRDADALLVQWAPITAKVAAALNNCKVIVRYGIGVDNVDLKATAEKGIAVCNIPDYCLDEVADHSLSMALALARQLPQTDARLRAGDWKFTPPRTFPALRDVTFATAGLGRIARTVLERAKAFGFKLAAFDPYVDASVFEKLGVRRLSKENFFREAGIVSLHLPLSPETKHFVGKAQLVELGKEGILINTARGGLIDTLALAEALTNETIFGAGIDVFEKEPLPSDHPLRKAPNAILTSHTAWYSGGSIPVLQRKTIEEAIRGLRGEPLQNCVNGVKPQSK